MKIFYYAFILLCIFSENAFSNELSNAIRNRLYDKAIGLIENGYDVNAKSERNAAILEAIDKNHTYLIELLIKHGADVNVKFYDKRTPLMYAVNKGNHKLVELLLQNKNIDINAQNKEGETALFMAARNGDAHSINMLLQHNADLTLTNARGQNPLYIAAYEKHHRAIKALLKAFMAMPSAQITYITANLIVMLNDINIIANALQAGAGIHYCTGDNESLLQAALDGNIEQIQAQLTAGKTASDKGTLGYSALMLATLNNQEAAVKLLMEKSDKSDADNMTKALDIAIARGNVAIVKLLLQGGAKANKKSNALYEAAQQGHVATFDELYTQDIMKDFTQENVFIAFITATSLGNIEMLKTFIKHGFDSNSLFPYMPPALMVAAENGQIETVNFLLDNGAHIEIQHKRGNEAQATSLFVATEKGYLDVVKVLVERGAKDLDKAIAMAAQMNHHEVVDYLLTKNVTAEAILFALTQAVGNHSEQAVQSILKKESKNIPSKDLAELFQTSVKRGLTDIPILFMEYGVEPTLLTLAYAYKVSNWELIQLIEKKGLQFSDDVNYWAPRSLYLAVKNGNIEIVKHLLKKGVNPNIRPSSDSTIALPLIAAISDSKNAIVSLLLEYKASPNISFQRSLYPVHIAARDNNLEAMKNLIEYKADINVLTGHYETALIIAIRKENMDMVKLLLKHNADTTINNWHGESALSLASSKGNKELVALLSPITKKQFANLDPVILAQRLLSGEGAMRDTKKALELYQKAIDAGNDKAQYILGLKYLHGEDVKADHAKGLELLRKSAAQSNGAAQYDLAWAYYKGRGVPKNQKEAVALWHKSLENGYMHANYMLGLSYIKGEGVAKDAAKGVAYMQGSMEHYPRSGHPKYHLALCYLEGNGVAKDVAKARRLLRMAVRDGHKEAKEKLGTLTEEPAAVAQVKKDTVPTKIEAKKDATKNVTVADAPVTSSSAPAPADKALADKASTVPSPSAAPTASAAPVVPSPKKPGKAVIMATTADIMSLNSFTPDQKSDTCVQALALHSSPLTAARLESMRGMQASWKTKEVKTKALGVLAVQQDGKILNANDAAFSLDISQETLLTLCVQDNGALQDANTRMRVIFYHKDGSRTYSIVQK